MARVAIPITRLSDNAGTVGAGTAGNTTDGNVINAGGRTDDLFLHAYNGGTVAGTVTLKAGDNPPSLRQALGDVAISVGTGANSMIKIESARFAQSDGTIEIDVTPTGVNLTFNAYRVSLAGVS